MSTITYYSLIVITQNELGKCISTISHAIWSPRTHCFSSKSKIHQIVHFGAISGCRKMQKWVILIFRYPKHDPRTRTEPFEPMWFLFWEHGERKTRYGFVYSYIEVLSHNNQLSLYFGQLVVQHINPNREGRGQICPPLYI